MYGPIVYMTFWFMFMVPEFSAKFTTHHINASHCITTKVVVGDRYDQSVKLISGKMYKVRQVKI